MGRGRGRGRGGGRNMRRQNLPPVRPLEEMRPVLGILRDDAIEIVDTDDMLELYGHGFYGKGTVSRRVPNRGAFEVLLAPDEPIAAAGGHVEMEERAMQVPPAGAPAGDAAGELGVGAGATQPAAKRARMESGTSMTANGASAGLSARASAAAASAAAAAALAASIERVDVRARVGVDDAMVVCASRSLDPRADALTRIAEDFERRVSRAPLPEAYAAAAVSVAHAQEPMSFAAARSVAHYISCPPPRTREASQALRDRLNAESAAATPAGSATAVSAVSGAAGAAAAAGAASGATAAVSGSGAAVTAPAAAPAAAPASASVAAPAAAAPVAAASRKLVVMGSGAPEGARAMQSARLGASSAAVAATAAGGLTAGAEAGVVSESSDLQSPSSAAPAAELQSRLVQETSILEPEAAVYLLHRRPGCLLLYVSPQQWGRYAPLLQAGAGGAAGGAAATEAADSIAAAGASSAAVGTASSGAAAPQQAPLTLQQLWALFCGRIPNFPARYGVYERFRDGGWVVREGSIFGADFVLYAKGPGWDHAPHCITVTPLRLAVEAGDGTAATAEGEARGAGDGADGAAVSTRAAGTEAAGAVAPASAGAAAPQLAAAASVHAPPAPLIRAPARPALGNWVEVHAVGRVIGNVRKHNVAAYVTLPVPRAAAEAAERAEGETDGAEGAAGPVGARSPSAAGAGVGAGGSEGSNSSSSGGPFYPAPIAALLATPDCADSLQVQTQLLSRWHITADMTRKASAMMARAALAVTRAQAADEGLHIDLGLLEGQRSSLEAAQAANAAAKADARQRRAAQAAAAAAAVVAAGEIAAGDAAAAGAAGSASGSTAAGGSSTAAAEGAAQAQMQPHQHQVVNKSLVKAQVRALLAKQHTAAAPAGGAGAGSADSAAAAGSAASKKGGKGGHGPQFAHPSVHPIVLYPSFDDGRPGATDAAAAAVLAYELQLLRSCPQWNPADAANELYRNPYGRGLGGGFGHDASSAGAAGAADPSRRPASCAGSLTPLPPGADATLLRLHAEAIRAIDLAAAQPASAAFQALLEAATRRLVRTDSDSLADSAADSGNSAAAAGSAAVPEGRSRAWYLHSREWTKLRAS